MSPDPCPDPEARLSFEDLPPGVLMHTWCHLVLVYLGCIPGQDLSFQGMDLSCTAVIIEDRAKLNMKNETASIQNPHTGFEIMKIGPF